MPKSIPNLDCVNQLESVIRQFCKKKFWSRKELGMEKTAIYHRNIIHVEEIIPHE
jgi:hypothetical protein